MNNTTKNHVIIFSGPNFLSLTLLEYLLSKNFIVSIYTNLKDDWLSSTQHLKNNKRFLVDDNFKNINFNNINYSICIDGFDNKEGSRFKVDPNIKTIILTPFERFESFEKIKPSGENIATIYLGDIIGPRIDTSSPLLINKVIKNILDNQKMEIAIGELFYPIFVLDVAKKIFEFMFSFGPYGKTILLLGKETPSRDVWKINSMFFNNLTFKLDSQSVDRKLPRNIDRLVIKSDLVNAFKESYKWLLDNKTINKEIPKPVKEKIIPVKKKNKFVKRVSLALLLFIVSPIVSLLIATSFYYSSYKNFSENKIKLAEPFLVFAKESGRFFSIVPVVGPFYKEIQFVSDNTIIAGRILIDGHPILTSFSDLSGKILGNDVYDSSKFYLENQQKLQNIYNEFLQLRANIENPYYKDSIVKSKITEKIDLEKTGQLLKESDILFKNLSNILGQKSRKTYLVLFQNNMELRPTGGFIGSYGLATFENGRLIDLNVSDVYSADGQLKGHVEPPTPIRQYLGEANWYLRDSNWDPDFTVSAKRAEWFLDKEIGTQVDGVIAIDLAPIKDMLDVTGPVFLSDYNMDISSSNLYEKTQEEVENNFFAGSRKKASFLTALSRNLLTTFSGMSGKNKISMLKLIYDNLEERHIQIYLHDDTTQKSISTLNWDGRVLYSNCGDNCYADTVGVVEANLGVNKVNQFITRQINLNVNFDGGLIRRKLVLTLKNSASLSLGPSGYYKAYIRLISNKDSDVDNSGVWVEILPESEKTIEFNWTSESPAGFNTNSYKLYLRKQAGIDEFPFNLTVGGKNLYNGHLDKDLFIGN